MQVRGPERHPTTENAIKRLYNGWAFTPYRVSSDRLGESSRPPVRLQCLAAVVMDERGIRAMVRAATAATSARACLLRLPIAATLSGCLGRRLSRP